MLSVLKNSSPEYEPVLWIPSFDSIGRLIVARFIAAGTECRDTSLGTWLLLKTSFMDFPSMSREVDRCMGSFPGVGAFQDFKLVQVSRSDRVDVPARSCATTPRAAFLKLCELRNRAKRAVSLWSSREIEDSTELLVPVRKIHREFLTDNQF
jgi:hypothetical protein